MPSCRIVASALTALVLVGQLMASAATAQPGKSPSDVARAYVQRHRQELGLTGSDIQDIVVSSEVVSGRTGVTHVYLLQRYRGIEVHDAILNVNVGADGTVISAGNRFVGNIAAAAGGQSARKAALDAAAAAAGHLKLKPTAPFRVLARKGGVSEGATISDGGIAAKPIDARLVWVRAGGGVRLAWRLEIEEIGSQHWWIALVDAETGGSLGQHDLVVHDSALATASAVARPTSSLVVPLLVPDFPATDDATYRVFPLPLESPSDGPRSLVTNAPDPSASPFGWHDTNGVAGPEFTITRGNNVHAYADRDDNDNPDPGSSPDGGSTLTFDFPLDLAASSFDSEPAIVTNLFYWNNIMHDVTYGYGFDEAAGNFQVNNYGKGGLGADDVRAEAQDGSGTNNANFFTPVDGLRPRMQMYVWWHPLPDLVTVNTPAVIAGDYTATRAEFGPPLTDVGPITANAVLVGDGVGTPSNGCEPLVGFPAGRIALVDRGTCTFVVKVKHAQEAGAVAVIVVNNVSSDPFTMGGTDPTIAIPAVMVSLANGSAFKVNLPANATLRANPLTSIARDSSLDAGVIAHEYGHGISNRLTGGPAMATCLDNDEQMGEGWSDWFALTLTARPSDAPTTPRGVGTYVSFQPPDGVGIRPTPYTTDMSVNPSTYASVADAANISQPHGIGYVWNTMLWEIYWNLVDRHGYNASIYGDWTTGGNNLALQLVMDGMKFQPCSPGFVDGRDAILQADGALTGGANQCEIWRGFAKRGLGFSASQGSPFDRFDGVEKFDLPATCTAATFGGFRPPVAGSPEINPVHAGQTVPVKFVLGGPGSALVIDSQPVDCTTLVPTGAAPSPLTSPGRTGLSQEDDAYHVNWKTDTAWAGTCRRLTLRIPAASDGVAYFRFF